MKSALVAVVFLVFSIAVAGQETSELSTPPNGDNEHADALVRPADEIATRAKGVHHLGASRKERNDPCHAHSISHNVTMIRSLITRCRRT